MKTIVRSILISFFFVFSLIPLYAQEEQVQLDENTQKVDNTYFELTLERKTQSTFNKQIPYVLTVTPHIDSERTQIIWNVPSTLEADEKHGEFVSLKEGETYTFKANIKPLREGTYDFSVSVISWQHDTNYTNSIDDSLVLSNRLIVQPVTTEYQTMTILKVAMILIAFVVLIFLTIYITKKYMLKAKKWLTPPN